MLAMTAKSVAMVADFISAKENSLKERQAEKDEKDAKAFVLNKKYHECRLL